jgi:hypothetical protein
MPAGPASALIPVSGPPIPRWGGLPPVVRGNVATHRYLSAEYTLQQHVSRSSAARLPSVARRGPRNSFPSGSTSAGTSISTSANMVSAGTFSGNIAVLVAVYPLVVSSFIFFIMLKMSDIRAHGGTRRS